MHRLGGPDCVFDARGYPDRQLRRHQDTALLDADLQGAVGGVHQLAPVVFVATHLVWMCHFNSVRKHRKGRIADIPDSGTA